MFFFTAGPFYSWSCSSPYSLPSPASSLGLPYSPLLLLASRLRPTSPTPPLPSLPQADLPPDLSPVEAVARLAAAAPDQGLRLAFGRAVASAGAAAGRTGSRASLLPLLRDLSRARAASTRAVAAEQAGRLAVAWAAAGEEEEEEREEEEGRNGEEDYPLSQPLDEDLSSLAVLALSLAADDDPEVGAAGIAGAVAAAAAFFRRVKRSKADGDALAAAFASASLSLPSPPPSFFVFLLFVFRCSQ